MALALLLGVEWSAPAQARDWSSVRLEPAETIVDEQIASPGIGSTVVVYAVSRSPQRPQIRAALRDRGGEFGPAQVLDDESFYPRVVASPAGGAVAAWYAEDDHELRVAELPPGGSRFLPPYTTPASGGDYSYGRPQLAMNDRGDAIVVYLADRAGLQQLMYLHRPAGGSFGPPEPLTELTGSDQVYARDAVIGPDGTAVVGYVRSGRAHVAVRDPSGTFTSEALGEPVPEHSWNAPVVGVDAGGDVVAAWVENTPGDITGPVRLAIRRAGSDRFAQAVDAGLRAADVGRIHLGVSAAGEAVLVIEAGRSVGRADSWYLDGFHALYASAPTGEVGPSSALTGIWGDYPSFAMNARGDAVVVWDECCPMALRSRRRQPLGPFEPAVDVAPPISFVGMRANRFAYEAGVDPFGNAQAIWSDGEPTPPAEYVSDDGPLITQAPPSVVWSGAPLAPVLAADESLPTEPQVPAPAPPPPPLRPAARLDRTAPKLSLRVERHARRRLGVKVRCSERCRLSVAARSGRTRLRPVGALARARVTRRLAFRIPKAAAHRRVRIDAVATDAAGNSRRARRVVRLR